MKNELILIIPFYNDEVKLKKSLKTIDEEITLDILLIDDGSYKTVSLSDLKLGKCVSDIHIVRNSTNLGIAKSLNIGLEYSKRNQYNYIARLDAGDFFYKNKLTKQYKYLKDNKKTKLLGTWARVVDNKGNFLHYIKHPSEYSKIKKAMFLNSMFIHPSVMFSAEIFKKIDLYPTNYKAAEDYAFFFKIVNYFKSENYPEILMDYTAEEGSISSRLRKTQVINRIRIILDNFKPGLYPVYGIIRNSILLLFSRKFTTTIKKITIQ